MLTWVFRQTRQVKLPKDSEAAQETNRRHYASPTIASFRVLADPAAGKSLDIALLRTT